jgi:ketosteroid isomerase-like protein
MAQQDNVAIIRKIYAAFGAGDVNAILASVADDAEWINYGPPTIPYAGSRSGRAQINEFFNAIGSSTTGGKVTAETFIAQGDTVVATGRYAATVRGTGAQIDTPVAHIFTLRNGKVTKWIGFSDTAHVAEAHTGATSAAGR